MYDGDDLRRIRLDTSNSALVHQSPEKEKDPFRILRSAFADKEMYSGSRKSKGGRNERMKPYPFLGFVEIITLSGAPPPSLRHPPVARVPYYLYTIVENFPSQVIQRHRNAP